MSERMDASAADTIRALVRPLHLAPVPPSSFVRWTEREGHAPVNHNIDDALAAELRKP